MGVLLQQFLQQDIITLSKGGTVQIEQAKEEIIKKVYDKFDLIQPNPNNPTVFLDGLPQLTETSKA